MTMFKILSLVAFAAVVGVVRSTADDESVETKAGAKFEGFEHLTMCRQGAVLAQNQVLNAGGLQAHFGAGAAPPNAWPAALQFQQAGRGITVNIDSVRVTSSFYNNWYHNNVDDIQMLVYADGVPIAGGNQPPHNAVNEHATHNYPGAAGLTFQADWEVRINVFEVTGKAKLVGVMVFHVPTAWTFIHLTGDGGGTGLARYRFRVRVTESGPDTTKLLDFASANVGNSAIRHFTLCAMAGDYFNGRHNFGADTHLDRFKADIISFDVNDNNLNGPAVVTPMLKSQAARDFAFSNVFNDWWDAIEGVGPYVHPPYNTGQNYQHEFRKMTALLISFINLERGARARLGGGLITADMYDETNAAKTAPRIQQYGMHTNTATENSARISVKRLPDIRYRTEYGYMAMLKRPLIAGSPVMQGLMVNFDHFGDAHAQWSYDTGHNQAVNAAIAAAGVGGGAGAILDALRKAVAMDGHACHFATDQYAAGHVRSPRADMYKWRFSTYCGGGCGTSDDGTLAQPLGALTYIGILANSIHDEENEWGLFMESDNAIWKARGDKHYFLRPFNAENARQGALFVQHSLRDLVFAFSYGVAPMTKAEYDSGVVPGRLAAYAAMTRATSPYRFLPQAMPTMPAGPNFPPLFKRFWDGGNGVWRWKYRTTLPSADRTYLAAGALTIESEYTLQWSCAIVTTGYGIVSLRSTELPNSIAAARANLHTIHRFDTDGDGFVDNGEWTDACVRLMAPPSTGGGLNHVIDVNTRSWRQAIRAVRILFILHIRGHYPAPLRVTDLDVLVFYGLGGRSVEEFIKWAVVGARNAIDPFNFLEESSRVHALSGLRFGARKNDKMKRMKLERAKSAPAPESVTQEAEQLLDKTKPGMKRAKTVGDNPDEPATSSKGKKRIAKDLGFTPGEKVYKLPGQRTHQIPISAKERDNAWVKQKEWIERMMTAHYKGLSDTALTPAETTKVKAYLTDMLKKMKTIPTSEVTDEHLKERFKADKELAAKIKLIKAKGTKISEREYFTMNLMRPFEVEALTSPTEIKKHDDKAYADLLLRVQHERIVENMYQSTLLTPEANGKPNKYVMMTIDEAWDKNVMPKTVTSGIPVGASICCCAPVSDRYTKIHAMVAASKNLCISTRSSSCAADKFAKVQKMTKDMSSSYRGTCDGLYEKAAELERDLRTEMLSKGVKRPKIELPEDMKTVPLGKTGSGVGSVGQRVSTLWAMGLEALGLRKKAKKYRQLAVDLKVIETKSKDMAAKAKGSHVDPTKRLGDTKKSKSTGSILQQSKVAIAQDRKTRNPTTVE